MNKKTSLAIFTIFLLGCNNPSVTLNPEISITPSPTSVSALPSVNVQQTIRPSITLTSSPINAAPSLVASIRPDTSATPSITSSDDNPITVDPKQIKKVEIFDKNTNNLFYSSEPKEYSMIQPYIHENSYKDIRGLVTYNDGITTDNVIFKVSDESLALINNDRIVTNEYKSGSINIIVLLKDTNQEIFRTGEIGINACPWDCYFIDALRGKIYDDQNNLISGAKVTVKTLELGYQFISDETITDENGFYKIRYIPAGAKLAVTVSKQGYKTIERSMVLQDYNYDLERNYHDFGGNNKLEDKAYILVPDKLED